VIQTEYGVSKKWYKPFLAPFQLLWRNRRARKVEVRDIEATEPTFSTRTSPDETLPKPISASTSEADDRRVVGQPLVVSVACKSFGKQDAIKNISISVSSDKILALLGPNGAGKSTLVNCALGLYKLSSGTIMVNGFDITQHHDQVYHHIGVCPQYEILWPDLTPKEHLLFYCRLKGVEAKMEDQVVTRCLEEVDLLSEQHKLSKELSGGQKRRLAIAIALVARPAVVFLDEPTTGNPFQNVTNPRT
jgi:ABC-type branched-subunit amino acid transport system ATPase component